MLYFKVRLNILEDKPENRRPTITSVRDPTIAVAYGNSVQLQCKVNAYPKPSLLWIEEKSGTIVSQMVIIFNFLCSYISPQLIFHQKHLELKLFDHKLFIKTNMLEGS